MSIQSKSLYAIILTLACLASGYYLYNTVWPNYSSQQMALNLAQTENQQLQDTLDSTKDFIEKYNQQASNPSNIDQFLPAKEPDVPNLLANIESLAGQSAIVLSEIQIVDSATKISAVNAVQPVGISFSASGTYPQLKDFITKIQLHLRLMDVTNITLAANNLGDQSNSTPILIYQIKLNTYYQK
ncbi:MAG: hypothetical protein A3I07_01295 [Candidatus Doudnabacteria bacterium RIFCSPLOWO2_02_FULL_42_9]|uniref:Uncharacterized protein n=1 Tax=Candidatus Doudnabacteria bacterium RIFCSPHIGHO2_01_FULL_41_86 TaxID=1817821 RepID=A0A1F5N8R8_9BACT|nr:MAG: hypothetical protein A2717_00855 [Candidatus Doudnabacteria bacterium RIFCSPHIGHO2_01_FULL_41_86]OGE75392.1 MAG: hypothetical protein A3K07_01370 [Candidatus Doudnabacteria bacterium RIFCSPHIGHO2_01_43_10]OGE86582.1 MAG: hypothetical protein A3E28_04200 [Candidatus Doudnabacteria bacterium RIFCSPHIGHO2_12_FULL_42_22]OGE87482.1 MAG: hypothetical protein A3C49_03860 [Candidatus Doudnabacteria bacterium RIFCSPHIGHO2_02_FULL_42_25]OGE92783.1 MAG: hypothetical protein A2895_04655 [Candidatus